MSITNIEDHSPSETKHISQFVRYMMNQADVTPKVAAACIGCSLGTFRNKLTLDRFSVKDLIILSELCDYHLAFVPIKRKDHTELLSTNAYISEEDRAVVKAYRKKKLQKNLDILETYMEGMTLEEKQKFVNEKLPGMINGTSDVKPKE